MRISRAQWDDLLAHAREEAPNECCGYLWCSDGVVQGLKRSANDYESPRYGYKLDSKSMIEAWKLDDEHGYQVGTYHSHPRSAAEPSQTDINIADYPDWLYVIVSPTGDGDVRAWWIRDRKVTEEEVQVES